MSRTGASVLNISTLDQLGFIAARLASALKQCLLTRPMLTINLVGELGSGKTTFSQRLIAELGHDGSVKSPTYTLVESYEIVDLTIHHFDFYRLDDPEELEYMGIRDYFAAPEIDSRQRLVQLIEWPDRGAGQLPPPDMRLTFDLTDSGRTLDVTVASGLDCIEAALGALPAVDGSSHDETQTDARV